MTVRPDLQTQVFDPKVTAHFHASAELYKLWSPEGHLHFGYWAWPMNPFRRRQMLEALVHHVVRELDPRPHQHLVDFGCGYGSAARLVAEAYRTKVDAFTVVDEQVQEGTAAALADGTADRVTMKLRDFRHSDLPDASVDGLYALESLCYGTGPDKSDVLAEAARILKPGARLATADGFMVSQVHGLKKKLVDTVAKGWALPCFSDLKPFCAALEANGFNNVQVEDLSWKMGPCALHGPPLLAYVLVKRWLSGVGMEPLEKAHLRSCALGILLGTQHHLFRYCMVVATRDSSSRMP